MYVLGLSFGMHDCAAALIEDGRILWAIEEERLDRRKHSGAFPINSIEFVLERQGIQLDDIGCVAFNFCPEIIQNEIIERVALEKFPKNFEFFNAMRRWRKSLETGIKRQLRETLGFQGRIIAVDHHMAHAASSYYCSPFKRAIILTIDGTGDRFTTAIWKADGSGISFLKGNSYPHSLGTLYSAVTSHLGLGNFAEGKTMGLASYGEEQFRSFFDALIISPPANSGTGKHGNFFELNNEFLNLPEGAWRLDKAFNAKSLAVLGPPRRESDPLTQHHMNIAASLQGTVERFICGQVAALTEEHGTRDVCLAGGVALNSVINGKLLQDGHCDNLFVQPAAGDSGTAVGSALFVSHELHGAKRGAPISHVFWGGDFEDHEITQAIATYDLEYSTTDDPAKAAAKLLADNLIIGWFQGAMEFGPRALGHRSILANPCQPDMKDRVNTYAKRRETFRPFAASVPEQDYRTFFTLQTPSPFMLVVSEVRDGVSLPAVTHVDNSVRIQTINQDVDPLFWKLHKEVEKHTGVPVLLNTSFNVKGEPLVCTPEDAIKCFLSTNLDALVIGRHIVMKSAATNVSAPSRHYGSKPFAPVKSSIKAKFTAVQDYAGYWATFVRSKTPRRACAANAMSFYREL